MAEVLAGKGFFGEAPTIWSTILKAKVGHEESRLSALGRLLERYRPAIQSEIRWQRRCSEDEAEELTAQFVATCLRRDFLRHVSPDQGRFRTFIKHCIHNFLRDLHAMESAQKRHSGQTPLSLDVADENGSRVIDPPDLQTAPGSTMDRDWALAVLGAALAQLEKECHAARRGELFVLLRPMLGGVGEGVSLATVAALLRMTEGAVKVAAHRLRQRLGELVKEEVRQTIGDQDDWRDELRYLVELLGR
jgi:RNA polymerase sigma factor (sigma-70 family)